MMPRMLGMRCSAMPLAALTTTGRAASASMPPLASRLALAVLPSTSRKSPGHVGHVHQLGHHGSDHGAVVVDGFYHKIGRTPSFA